MEKEDIYNYSTEDIGVLERLTGWQLSSRDWQRRAITPLATREQEQREKDLKKEHRKKLKEAREARRAEYALKTFDDPNDFDDADPFSDMWD